MGSFATSLLQGAKEWFKNYASSPTRDPAQARSLEQVRGNLKTSLRDVDNEISRLSPKAWSADAKAARAQNAPRVAELMALRRQLSDQLFEVEKVLKGGRTASTSRLLRDMR